MAKLKIKESEIQKTILDYLRLQGYFCWRNQTVGIFKRSTGTYIPSQNVGSPDIFCLHGELYGIEVKSATGKLSEYQKQWRDRFEKAGGKYIVCRSLEDIQKHL